MKLGRIFYDSPRRHDSTMDIQEILEQALKDGYLTPSMEAEVGRICDAALTLPPEEYEALDRLMGALVSGEIGPMPRKHFTNVMEELVTSEAINRVAELENTKSTLDVGDIAAYALNRLPPLYATTEEGANYQRQRAKEQLQELIRQQVNEAVNRYLDRPEFFPERNALSKITSEDILNQMSTLLQSYAPNYEGK